MSGGDIVSRFEDRTANTAVVLTRHQPDGTLVWKRRIKHNSWALSTSPGRMKITANGNILVSFSQSGGNNTTIVAQLPGDGSLTGTHGNWIWEDPSDVTADETMTNWSKQGSSIFSNGSTTMNVSTHANVAETANNMTGSLITVD